jgi:AraC-like DNA-binding protein
VRTINVLFENDSILVRSVRCSAPAGGCGPIEQAGAHTIVFPETGVFVRHVSRHQAIVADSAHAVFFTRDEPYRVSHPAAGGDTCIVLELRGDALADVLRDADRVASEAPNAPFRTPAIRLLPRLVVRRRLLRHRLARRTADPLEVQETVAELVSGTVRCSAPNTADQPVRRHDLSRRLEIVRATQATLAANPVTRWTLAGLAKRVDCSPFHLAHVFRRVVGTTIHHYHVRARLTEGLGDILDSTRGLSEIAVDLGFTHHSHFSNAFRRLFGVTPSALRRNANASDATRLRKFLTAP